MSKPVNAEVVLRPNESAERLIRRFIKQCKRRDFMKEVHMRRYFEKPSDKRRREKSESDYRRRRDERRKAAAEAKRAKKRRK